MHPLDIPSHAAVITPHATNVLATPTKAINVGVAGDVAVYMLEDTASVILKLPAGIHWLQVKRVLVTGTTATNLVALW